MTYDKKLIDKAKVSRCRICWEYITEAEADACEFQACKTSRGGALPLLIPGAGRERRR
ncbi:MAG TPA: hypothetical protein GXX75_23420 [Clostridiales bacterium]|nr:hypothetical protein [Clostridiales bacterium]